MQFHWRPIAGGGYGLFLGVIAIALIERTATRHELTLNPSWPRGRRMEVHTDLKAARSRATKWAEQHADELRARYAWWNVASTRYH